MRKSFKCFKLAIVLLLCVVMTGCGTVLAVSVLAVGAGALVGYGVYKTGEAGVGAVADAGKASAEFAGDVGGQIKSGAQKTAETSANAASKVASAVYFGGDLKVTYPASIDRVWMAANESVVQMGFTPTTGTYDALSGHIFAKTAKNEDVRINLKGLSDTETEANIRIGVTGDKVGSEMIQEKISNLLLLSAQ